MSLHRHQVLAAAIALAALTSSSAWSAVFSAHHSRHSSACPTAVESNLKKEQSSGHPDLMKQGKKGNVSLDDPHYVPAKGAIEQDNAQKGQGKAGLDDPHYLPAKGAAGK